jgi:large-conductance mechanosensitive channel
MPTRKVSCNLVQSRVKDLLLPAIDLALPGLSDLPTYQYLVNEQVFGVGNFLVALIAFIVFIIGKAPKNGNPIKLSPSFY